jgi:alkaline phosphatase
VPLLYIDKKCQLSHLDAEPRALVKTLELESAVEVAVSLLDLDDSLIAVTADHSHTLAINGYQDRGSDIRGDNSAVIFTFSSVQGELSHNYDT